MTTFINASTSSGLVVTSDNSGAIALQSNGTTAALANLYGIGLATAVPSSGVGIAFPATQVASSDPNTLDDYEEGTWTATYSAGTIASQNCQYTKIGRLVSVSFQINWTASGTLLGQIGGMPFVISTVNYLSTHSREWYNTGNTTQCVGSVGSATMDLFFYNNTRGVTNGSLYGVSGTIVYNTN
jgi:hypothetical protein